MEGLHLRAHAVRRAFLDRLALFGDSAEVKAPWDRLVSKEYARELAAEIRRVKRAGTDGRSATPENTATGHGLARGPWSHARLGVRREPRGRHFAAPLPPVDCTTHVGVVDRHRNMVSLTHTVVSIFA